MCGPDAANFGQRRANIGPVRPRVDAFGPSCFLFLPRAWRCRSQIYQKDVPGNCLWRAAKPITSDVRLIPRQSVVGRSMRGNPSTARFLPTPSAREHMCAMPKNRRRRNAACVSERMSTPLRRAPHLPAPRAPPRPLERARMATPRERATRARHAPGPSAQWPERYADQAELPATPSASSPGCRSRSAPSRRKGHVVRATSAKFGENFVAGAPRPSRGRGRTTHGLCGGAPAHTPRAAPADQVTNATPCCQPRHMV